MRAQFARWIADMSVSRLLATTIGLLFALAAIAIGLALLANGQLAGSRRQLLEQVGPALRSGLELENALVNEESGVRGYLIAGKREYLAPYLAGLAAERHAYAELRSREQAVTPAVARKAQTVRSQAEAWRRGFVAPALASSRHGLASARLELSSSRSMRRRSLALNLEGKRLFDGVRSSLTRLHAALLHEDITTRRRVNQAASELQLLLVLAAILVLGGVLGAWLVLRASITRPLLRLGSQARRVGGGEFATPLQVAAGPREIADLGTEIESMRERIVTELASVQAAHRQVEQQARELSRSNAELEQFAYVASHDLREPLRKIASFCEALQRRYGGRLDARADQYIEFAVDGARRMQSLIDDLLTFSRVGSGDGAKELLPLAEALDAARTALAGSIEQSGAEISAGQLPRVQGDRALLGSLFQNLISNAVKFRGASPPRVRIEAQRRGQEWEVSCADNGIGVGPDQAERIFLVFQRLHPRQAYEGSGIGLSLARKIVEHHGGRIWLDAAYEGGACFRFTLPVVEGEGAKDAGDREEAPVAGGADVGQGEPEPERLAGRAEPEDGGGPPERAGRAAGPQARMGD